MKKRFVRTRIIFCGLYFYFEDLKVSGNEYELQGYLYSPQIV